MNRVFISLNALAMLFLPTEKASAFGFGLRWGYGSGYCGAGYYGLGGYGGYGYYPSYG